MKNAFALTLLLLLEAAFPGRVRAATLYAAASNGIWMTDATTGASKGQLNNMNSNALAFNNGTLYASGSNGIWMTDAATGASDGQLNNLSSYALAFNNGTLYAAAGNGIWMFDAATGGRATFFL